ncbi:MAG: triple tyrosine motif-containing protein, partial [Ignavibacteriaceae bacterium]
QGLNTFTPDNSNTIEPDLIFSDIKIFNKSIKSYEADESPLETSLLDLEKLDLTYDQNDLTFSFAALHYSNPNKNLYAHKLIGYDKDWVFNNKREATYTNLDPGKYTFSLKGSNRDGVWSSKDKSIKIIINPPWWYTTWAYIGYGLFLVFGIFTIDRKQRKRLLSKAQERIKIKDAEHRAEAAELQAKATESERRALELEFKQKKKELEQAKEIEKAYTELKATQAQLVHSEKIASLGELTAGIAHEIKNPLNFINNFSEISNELLDEVKTELKNRNEEEVADLIENLKQNLEKINQHGKRADSIVKGMLLHSRGTSGEKTLTDINDLLDQYVNLAYHGMRATNKEFNITIEKDYDESLEKINVVPQDISRV